MVLNADADQIQVPNVGLDQLTARKPCRHVFRMSGTGKGKIEAHGAGGLRLPGKPVEGIGQTNSSRCYQETIISR